jgi:formylmethanofuran dehydrogenase subunit E
MESDQRFKKVNCSKCGELCYKLCYVGDKVVCVDCFHEACSKMEKRANHD